MESIHTWNEIVALHEKMTIIKQRLELLCKYMQETLSLHTPDIFSKWSTSTEEVYTL